MYRLHASIYTHANAFLYVTSMHRNDVTSKSLMLILHNRAKHAYELCYRSLVFNNKPNKMFHNSSSSFNSFVLRHYFLHPPICLNSLCTRIASCIH